MSHKIVVGGVASSEVHMKRVTEKLSAYYDEEIEGVTLKDAFNDPLRLSHMLDGNTVLTHSTGMEAIRHTNPQEIVAIAPVLRSSPGCLLGRTALSIMELAGKQLLPHDLHSEVGESMKEAAKELLRYRKEYGYLGRIARSHAFEIANQAREAGIPTSIAFMSGDRMFQPNPTELRRAIALGTRAVSIAGPHEEFTYNPVGVMQKYVDALRVSAGNDPRSDRWHQPFIKD